MVPVTKKMGLSPPDGGWGWMVVLGVALTNTFNQSLLSLFGLLFGDKLTDMGQGTVGAAWVANIMLLVFNFSGLVTGPALKSFSSRTVTIIGSLLAGGGMIAASFSTSVWHLIVTYSVFTGLGIGLIQPSAFVAVNSYFRAKRGRAVGVSMAGTGIGQMLMPHLVRYLLDSYGFRGTALILGALAFNGIVGAALFQPVEWHMVVRDHTVGNEKMRLLPEKKNETLSYRTVTMETEDRLKKRRSSMVQPPTFFEDISMSLPFSLETLTKNEKAKSVDRFKRSQSYCVSLSVDSNDNEKEQRPKEVSGKPQGIWNKVKRLLDLDLLLDFTFINIIFSCGLVFTSNQNFNMLFPFYLQAIGFDRQQTAMCMSAMAATDIIGRLTIPSFTDKFKISSRITFLFGCLTLILSRQVLCLQYNYIAVIMASGLCGFFRSTIVVNQNLVVSEYCKEDESKLPAALGLNMVMKGISIISIGQFLGWIRDYTGSYYLCIYAQNTLLGMIIALWTPELVYKYLKDKKR